MMSLAAADGQRGRAHFRAPADWLRRGRQRDFRRRCGHCGDYTE